MKTTLVLLSLSAITVLVTEIIRLHSTEFTRWAVFYLAAQFLFMFVCWRAAMLSGWKSLSYMQAFYGTMSLLCVTAIVLSFKFSGSIPHRHAKWALVEIVATCIAIVCGTFLMAMSHSNMLTKFAVGHILCAGILVFCGVLSLASLAFPSDVLGDLLKIFLGIYWLAQGAYGLVEPALFIRGKGLVVARMSFIPIVISAVTFTMLAAIVRSYQREGSRSSLAPDTQVEEAHGASVHGWN